MKDRIRAIRYKQLSRFERMFDRITCGDCMKLLPVIPDGKVDLIVTDPPYGIDYKSNRRKKRLDDMDNDGALFTKWLAEAYRVLKNGGALYLFTHWRVWGRWQEALKAEGFRVKSMIVLNRNNHGTGDLECYAPKHELLMFATKGRHRLNKPGGRPKDVWGVTMLPASVRKHPTQKPPSWYWRAIAESSDEGDLVLDPFGGVGPCAQVCKQENRRFIVIEIEAHFCGEADRMLEGL